MLLPRIVLALAVVSGCSSPPSATVQPQASPTPTPAPTPQPTAEPGTVPPAWLGTRPLPLAANGLGQIQPTPPELVNRRFTLRDTLDALPGDGYASRIDPVPPDVLARSSWQQKCPVAAADLRWVRLAFWGFDDRRHTGELLVNADAADAIVKAFARLYEAKFPLEEMRITGADELDAPPTGDGNNTSAFTCKPLRGSDVWAEHAYGRAVDVNPFANPYIRGDVLIPELASAYADRTQEKPGMIHAGDAVTQAFASVGWGWGGSWQHSKDYMHFSANGR
ncbi:MAG: M15 family metallopeptidase [Aeromicrobium sp.]